MSDYEFDVTYSAITGEHVSGVYIPTVEHHGVHDILIDGGPTRDRSNGDMEVNSGWNALTGNTGQYGYHGAVMHASETMEDETVRELVTAAGGDVFAIVAVGGHSDTDPVFPEEPDYCEEYGCAHEPAGWTVIYQPVVECGPNAATWYGRGLWPVCKCGYSPRDNLKLTEHWASAGFSVRDAHGQLVVTPIAE